MFFFVSIVFSCLNNMPNKKAFTPDEAVQWILDIPSDFSDEIDSSDSDDDEFVPDALGLPEPIENELQDDEDEYCAVVEEDETSEYTESSCSSEEEAEREIGSNAGTDSINTVENVAGDVYVSTYHVDQDRHWTRKNKKQIDTPFTSPEGKSPFFWRYSQTLSTTCRVLSSRTLSYNNMLMEDPGQLPGRTSPVK